jgi:tRNA-specific 2-thiouridylase
MAERENSVLVAMSGGVDSSVAASLLLEEGYEVTGVFLCLGSAAGGGDESSGCCTPADAADARRVAQTLGIDLHVLNAGEPFERIIDYFAAEYARGRTPNPCVHCNAQIKFARLIRLADSLGARHVATGHHARIVARDGQANIARGRDRPKDQSYALFGIARENLPRVLLPIGEIDRKARVRQKARALGLNVHDKRDSQEICFVGEGDYAAVLRARAPQALRAGPILDAAGAVLGRHDGFAQFTIGQRRGLKVAAGEPMYVSRIDARTAAVTIGPKEHVLGTHLSASGANWHCDVPAEFDATVQVRYNHRGAPGRVRITDGQAFEVTFAEPVEAITPGQAAAVYDGQCLLGGGWIDS